MDKSRLKKKIIDNITYIECDMGIEWRYKLNSGKIIHIHRQTEIER